MNYSQKLLNPKWQKKRLQILERDSFSCRHCGDEERTLHVHHKAYTSSNPWETEDNLLITLCESCHKDEEINLKENTSNLISRLKEKGLDATDFESLMWFILDSDFDLNRFHVSLCALRLIVDEKELMDNFINKEINRRKEAMDKIRSLGLNPF